MGRHTFTEAEVEAAALGWFAEIGYEVLYGPEIAPDGTHPERESYHEPLLTGRLQNALVRLNPALPSEAIDEAYRKLTRPASPSLVENNHTFHQYLTEGVTVEYRDDDGTVRIIDPSRPNRRIFTLVSRRGETPQTPHTMGIEAGRQRSGDPAPCPPGKSLISGIQVGHLSDDTTLPPPLRLAHHHLHRRRGPPEPVRL